MTNGKVDSDIPYLFGKHPTVNTLKENLKNKGVLQGFMRFKGFILSLGLLISSISLSSCSAFLVVMKVI